MPNVKLAPLSAYPCIDYAFWGEKETKDKGKKVDIEKLAQKDMDTILGGHFTTPHMPWIKRKCALTTTPVPYGDHFINYKICLRAANKDSHDLMAGDRIIYKNITYTIARLEIGTISSLLYLQETI